MHVQIVMPNSASAAKVRGALMNDEEFEVAEGPVAKPDVRIVHASLLPRSHSRLRAVTRASAPLVVTGAPDDPRLLADYLAAGVNGYHCRGEPWSLLPEVVRDAHAGGYRSDPSVTRHLLARYRALQKRSTSSDGFGPYLH